MEFLKLTSQSPFEFIGVPDFETNERREKKRAAERTNLSPNRAQLVYSPMKRVIDICGALMLGIIALPVSALIVLAIRLSSPGPVIFRQRRLTCGGKEFTMYKFRTMLVDAESRSGPVWASKKDPRVTYVGAILRKLHLDELPQLLNVIRGEMSLIGPRPERPEMVGWLSEELPSFKRRMEVKGGITGLAQVSSGYPSSLHSYRKKLALDILYVQNHCLLLDLRIAARTLFVLVTGK